MTMTKSEIIKIQDGENVIELTGADKEAFLEQRAKDQAETDAIKAETEARKEAKLSALQKLGLTEEEINAIL
jgi:hypothetical protein